MPLFRNLRRKLLKECHDSQWAGHPGVHSIIAIAEENYYWSRMRDDVEADVKLVLCVNKTRGAKGTGRIAGTTTDSRATLGKHLHGFHHGLTQVRGVQCYYGGGRPVLKVWHVHSSPS